MPRVFLWVCATTLLFLFGMGLLILAFVGTGRTTPGEVWAARWPEIVGCAGCLAGGLLSLKALGRDA